MKQVKVFFLGALLVSFLAMPVFAAPLQVNHGAVNAAYINAYETLGTSRSVNINLGTATTGTGVSINTVSVGFTLSQNITTAALLNLQLSGGLGFQAVPYNVCAPNTTGATTNVVEGSAIVGTATPTLNATTLSVLVSPNITTPAAANMTAGNTIFITSNPCSGGANNSIFPVNILANSAVGFGTVTGNITISGTAIDTPAARNMVQIASEFVPAFTANDIVRIDYLHSPFNGTTLDTTLGNAASNVIAVGLNKPGVALSATPAIGTFHFRTNAAGVSIQSAANNAGLSVNQILTIGDSNNWVGINKVYTTNGNGCLAGNTVTANVTTLSGNIALAPNAVGGAFNGSAANNATLCIQADGTTTLARRQFVGNYSFLMLSGGIAPTGATGVVFQTWVPNGYQAFNPYMYVGASTTVDNVFNRFYNNDTRTAKVYVEVFPADGTASQNFQLADIAPNSAGLYWASDIGGLAGLAVGTSYAAQFTITAAPDKVNGVSYFKRTTGDRQLTLYKAVNGAGQFLSE